MACRTCRIVQHRHVSLNMYSHWHNMMTVDHVPYISIFILHYSQYHNVMWCNSSYSLPFLWSGDGRYSVKCEVSGGDDTQVNEGFIVSRLHGCLYLHAHVSKWHHFHFFVLICRILTSRGPFASHIKQKFSVSVSLRQCISITKP